MEDDGLSDGVEEVGNPSGSPSDSFELEVDVELGGEDGEVEWTPAHEREAFEFDVVNAAGSNLSKEDINVLKTRSVRYILPGDAERSFDARPTDFRPLRSHL